MQEEMQNMIRTNFRVKVEVEVFVSCFSICTRTAQQCWADEGMASILACFACQCMETPSLFSSTVLDPNV